MPYLYIIQRQVFKGTSVYKFGMSQGDDAKRLYSKDYQKGAVVAVVWVNDGKKAERELFKELIWRLT